MTARDRPLKSVDVRQVGGSWKLSRLRVPRTSKGRLSARVRPGPRALPHSSPCGVVCGFAFAYPADAVVGLGLWTLRAQRRPRHSGRWLQTQTGPLLTLSSPIGASQGVSFALLRSFNKGPRSLFRQPCQKNPWRTPGRRWHNLIAQTSRPIGTSSKAAAS